MTVPATGGGAPRPRLRPGAALRTGLLTALVPGALAAQAAVPPVDSLLPARIAVRLGGGALSLPSAWEEAWRVGPSWALRASMPWRGGHLEAGVDGARLASRAPGAFDPADPRASIPDLLLLHPRVGLGRAVALGPLVARATGHVGAQLSRIDTDGVPYDNRQEVEWAAGLTLDLEALPGGTFGGGVTATSMAVFAEERTRVGRVGAYGRVELGLPRPVRRLLGRGPGGDGPGGAPPPGDPPEDRAAASGAPAAGGLRPFEEPCLPLPTGATRLEDALADLSGWPSLTVTGFRSRWAPRGLTTWSSAGPMVRVDGVRVPPEPLGSAGLDRLPLDPAEIACIRTVATPDLVDGEYVPRGAVLVHTRAAPEGVAVTGAWTAGNEEGDPGPWAWTDRASPNVDKVFGRSAALVSARRGAATLRLGVGRRSVWPTDPALVVRSIGSWAEGDLVRIRATPVWLRGRWDDGTTRVDVSGGRSRARDFVFSPALGRELPAVTDLRSAGVSARRRDGGGRLWSVAGEWGRSDLLSMPGRIGFEPDLRLDERGMRVGVESAPGPGDPRGPGARASRLAWRAAAGVRDQRARERGIDLAREQRGHLAGGLGWLGGRWGGEVAVEVARDVGTTRWLGHVGGHLRDRRGTLAVRLGRTAVSPLDDRTVFGLRDRGVRAFDALLESEGTWSRAGGSAWSLDLEAARPGGLAAGAWVRRHDGLALPLQRHVHDPDLDAFPAVSTLHRGVGGTVAGGWARVQAEARGVELRAAWEGQTVVDGPEAFRQAFGVVPEHGVRARAGWTADPLVTLFGGLRARSGVTWSAYEGLSTVGDRWDETVGAWMALDVGGALELLGGRARLQAAVRNVTNAQVRWHPTGMTEERGLYVAAWVGAR